MRRIAVMVVLVAASWPSASPGQFAAAVQNPPPVWKVKVILADDKVVEGTVALKEIRLVCDLGTYDIQVEKIKEVRFDEPAVRPNEVGAPDRQYGRAEVVTTTGEVIRGDFSAGVQNVGGMGGGARPLPLSR